MKRIRTMNEPPPGLSSYLEQATAPSYAPEFRDYEGGVAYNELIAGLIALQRGRCGYCEVNLADFDHQLEHIAPQSRHPERALDTKNMLASCKGGSVPSEDKERFLKPPKRNLSCGQAKGSLDDPQFRDPHTLPALPSLLVVRHDGRIHADPNACQSEEEIAQIEKTITVLGLNVERLRMARQKRWENLLENLGTTFREGQNDGPSGSEGVAAPARRSPSELFHHKAQLLRQVRRACACTGTR